MSIERLFKLYVQALSHKVRTPLGVIANDLQFFGQSLGEGEVSRSLEKCRVISTFLKVPPERRADSSGITLKALATELGIRVLGDENICIHPAIAQAVNLIASFSKEGEISISKQKDQIVCIFSSPLSHEADHQKVKSSEYASISEYFSEELSLDSIDAPLTDAVLIDAKIDLVICETEEGLKVEFNFP